MESQTLDFVLTTPQFRKFNKKQGFQLSYNQLVNHFGTHHIEITISKSNYKKLMRSINGKRGFRFSAGMIENGSLLNKQRLGAGFHRKHNPPEYKKLGLFNDDSDSDSDSDDDIKETVMGNVIETSDGNIKQTKVSGKKLMKGSIEMKEKMARLRAMRKPKGKGLFKKISKAFNPKTNGVAKAFSKNGVMEKVGKKIASTLIHQGIPYVAGTLGGVAGTALTENPLGGTAGSYAGKQLGTLVANKIGKRTGLGLRQKKIKSVASQLVGGVPLPIVETKDRIQTGSLVKRAKKNLQEVVGGSFLSP